ncbi:MAG: hypothetical protein ACRD3Q_21295 [Terriglobales bacterium]
MKHVKTIALLAAIALLTTGALAQAAPGASTQIEVTATSSKPGMMTMHIENDMDAAPVKGAPFCATVTTEHTQQFADGNRIHSADSSSLCRDSEGRTRREASLNLMGAGPQNAAKLVTIVDPVAGVRYILDPDSKVAHKSNFSSTATAPAPPGAPGLATREKRMIVMKSADGPQVMTSDVFFRSAHDDSGAERSTEDLGVQSFSGIRAMGTRMTTTIPAGKMDNEKPMVITSERWYSSDLKATVMTKHSDPWAGELKTEFISVNTSEPDASLFAVPSDYKIVDDKNGPVRIQMAPPAPPQPAQ